MPTFIIIYTWQGNPCDSAFYARLRTLEKWYHIERNIYQSVIKTKDAKALKELVKLCKEFEERGLRWEAYISYKVKT